jgi:predicted TIM-barrel fold metal-dependent hydrolase
MRIVDAQVHVWSADPADWVPLDGTAQARAWGRHYSLDELLEAMRAAGVVGAALIPPRWEGRGDAVVLDAADRHPETFIAVSRLDPFAPLAVDRAGDPASGIRAVRTMLGSPAEHKRILSGHADAVWAAAESRGTPVMIYPPHDLGVVERLAEAFPRLRIAVDHLGLPVGTRITEATDRLHRLARLAWHPGVSVKATALPTTADDAFPFASTHEPLRRMIDAFGPERVFWGSDLSRLDCPYEDAVGMALEALDEHDATARELVMGGALEAWLSPRTAAGAAA